MGLSRRQLLAALPVVCRAASTGSRGRAVPSAAGRYNDPSTEFSVTRLTDPSAAWMLPANFGRAIQRKAQFALCASDSSGSLQAYRLDLKNGSAKQLTEAESLDGLSLTMTADERSFCCVDSGKLQLISFSTLRPRDVYHASDGYEIVSGIGLAEDALYTALVERKASHYRLRLIRMLDGMAATLAESDEPLSDPIPRPRRASVLYRRGDGLWLANYDAQQNRPLKLNEGKAIAAHWSPDGRTILYLNAPAEPRKLNNIRENTPDTNEDRFVADTTQFAAFAPNSDATMFVGASGSKASPHVLLLARAVKREFT